MGSNQENKSRVPPCEGQSPLMAEVNMRVEDSHAEGADIFGCERVLFEWAESFDTKDWARLADCVAPTLYVSSFSFVI